MGSHTKKLTISSWILFFENSYVFGKSLIHFSDTIFIRPSSKVTNCMNFMEKKLTFERGMKNPKRRKNFDKDFYYLRKSFA
ncbi:hypothetical protein APS47_16205 [Leptospira kirschneri serovar Mozdok]|nr:hypothetical protein APS47_16205 [Leptospira kirschneri serovar Mozdok]OOV48780.1 hypothetical protein B1J94_09390 [Leptospira kirschneri serovar Grippotyphosa]